MKYKLKDKVLYKGEVYEITKLNNYKNIANDYYTYDIRLNNTTHHNIVGSLLKLYKSPYQELLDLGWELNSKGFDFLYFHKVNERLYIYNNKEFQHLTSSHTPIKTDLELAEVIIKFMKEEVEC